MVRLLDELLVSVVVPVLNEELYIEKFLNSLVYQDLDKDLMEVLIVDGMSSDNTRKIIYEYTKRFKFIRLLNNPQKKIPCALNIGIKSACGKYIIRMDAHSYFYPDYISNCIRFMEDGNYQNVGGPTVVESNTRIQRIISASYYSIFALGGGKNHEKNYEGLSDTVQFGTFNRNYITNLGLYDESIEFAEDDDLNFRILENGGKIFITPDIKFIYYPRKDLKSLFIQYFKYGLWKVAVIKKHKRPARISHLIPICFVVFLIFFPLISLFNRFVFAFTLSILIVYVFLLLFFSFRNKYLRKVSDKLILIFVHFLLHISYGLGSLVGIFKFSNKDFSNKTNLKKYNFSKSKLKELQKKNIDLISKFKSFCDKHNLKFFLCGGGCIGAIRHSGFIPWDDDLDIFMFRDDYEKLSKIDCSNESFSVVRSNDKFFSGQAFTMVSDKNSTLIKKEQIGLDIPRGVSLDVFPLDGCPDNKFKQKMQMINACIFSLYTTRVIPKKHGKLLNIVGNLMLKIIGDNKLKLKIASFFEKNMSKYDINKCKYVKELCAGPKYMKNLYDKKIFRSSVMKKFENIELPVPIGYDSYLKTAFGNYMELPPEKERVNSHDIVFMDLQNSYKNYKNQF